MVEEEVQLEILFDAGIVKGVDTYTDWYCTIIWVSATYEKETPFFNSFEIVIVKSLRSTAQIAIVHAGGTINWSSIVNYAGLGKYNILRWSRWRYVFLRLYYSTISSRCRLKRIVVISASVIKSINILKVQTSNGFVGLQNISESHWIPSLLLGCSNIRDVLVEYVIVHNALIKDTRSWLWSWTRSWPTREIHSVSLILIWCIESMTISTVVRLFIPEHILEHVLHTRQGALLLSWLNIGSLSTGPTPSVVYLVVQSGH